MAKIPESIVIGGITTDLALEEGLFHRLNKISVGFPDKGELKIAEEAPLASQKELAFAHIYLYICDVIIADDLDNPDEKWVVGKQLFAMIRDNPDLINIGKSVFDIPFVKYLGKKIQIFRRPAIMQHLASLNHALLFLDIHEDAKLDQQWLCLYHELIHLIRLQLAFDIRDESGRVSEEEERIVDGIAFLLVALFTQNDMSWVLEEDAEDDDSYTSHPVSS